MEIFIISFVVFGLMALALSLGQLLGRRAVQGSCGGLNQIPGLENSCGACGKKQCPRKMKSQS